MLLTLLPRGAPAIDLLSVHLKSGCARDPLDSESAACRLLAAQAAAAGLIDEYRMRVSPVLLGGGTPLFSRDERRVSLDLVDTRNFAGTVYLRYQVAR